LGVSLFGVMKGRKMDRVRVIRVLEYEGPRAWVEQTLSKNVIKGTCNFNNGICFIREAILGDFPAVVQEIKERRNLTAQEMKFMQRFGWELHENLGPEKLAAVKREVQTGKVIAHEGDETWDRDLKVAGE